MARATLIVADKDGLSGQKIKPVEDYLKSAGFEVATHNYTEGIAVLFDARMKSDSGKNLSITMEDLPFLIVENNTRMIRFYLSRATLQLAIKAVKQHSEGHKTKKPLR